MVSHSILTTDLIKYGKSDQVLDYDIHWYNNSLYLKYDRVNYCTNECHNHFIPLFIQQQHFEVLIKKIYRTPYPLQSPPPTRQHSYEAQKAGQNSDASH